MGETDNFREIWWTFLAFCTAVCAIVILITIIMIIKGRITRSNITLIFLYFAINCNLVCNVFDIICSFIEFENLSFWIELIEYLSVQLAIFMFVARTINSFSKIASAKILFKFMYFVCWIFLATNVILRNYYYFKDISFYKHLYNAISSFIVFSFLLLIYISSSIEMYRFTGNVMCLCEKILTGFLLTLTLGQLDASIYSILTIYAKHLVSWNTAFGLIFSFSITILIEIIPGLLLIIQISRNSPTDLRHFDDSQTEPLTQ